MEFVEIKTLIRNIKIKHSKSVKNLLCFVLENNEILLRYSNFSHLTLKIISFFKDNNFNVVSIELDQDGIWLFVLCLDNTLHVLPSLYLVDKSIPFDCVFNPTEITSYNIPTNGYLSVSNCDDSTSCSRRISLKIEPPPSIRPSNSSIFSVKKVNELATNSIYTKFYCDTLPSESGEAFVSHESFQKEDDDKTQDSKLSDSHTLSSVGCYPSCCCYWQTLSNEIRMIIGYTDGSLCVVGLKPSSCELIGLTAIERGLIDRMVICKDNTLETITLMINTSLHQQWKLLLEQKSIAYVFPGENNQPTKLPRTRSMSKSKSTDTAASQNDSDWQFVMQLQQSADENQSVGDITVHENMAKDYNSAQQGMNYQEINTDSQSIAATVEKVVPAAKGRLFERLETLKDLGAKKIGTLKLKLAESRIKAKEKEKLKEQTANLAIIAPGTVPEILTTPHGPYFILQYFLNKFFLSALHTYSDTLSVHSMDISLIPLFLYKVPSNCKDIILTENVMFFTKASLPSLPNNADAAMNDGNFEEKETIEEENLVEDVNSEFSPIDSPSGESKCDINTVGVVSCALAKTRIGDECEFNERSLIGLFEFPNEYIINIHRSTQEIEPEEVPAQVSPTNRRTSLSKYLEQHKNLRKPSNFDKTDAEVLQNTFPSVKFETCVVVTNKSVYQIELRDRPHIIFLELADKEMWANCEDFCKTFNLSLPQCIEFAGDIFLKKKKITQALMTYNIARIPPMKTALKLAMFNEVTALLHLCATALSNTHIINSKYPMSAHIKTLLDTANLRQLKLDSLLQIFKKNSLKASNEGQPCSDFSYQTDRASTDFQLSNSSQFHLSNLMFLSLCERSIKDKNYMPLCMASILSTRICMSIKASKSKEATSVAKCFEWNFIVTNSKYHTSLSSIILSQSGLYSSAVLLSCTSGACLDVFSGLVSASDHLLNMKPEINVFLYNLSDVMFRECITYLQNYSLEYFETIRNNIEKLEWKILKKLEDQLNPFHPVYRPIMCRINNEFSSFNQNMTFMEFFKSFIQTYITILIQLQIKSSHQNDFLNALNMFLVNYEEEQNAINVNNVSPMSAGFSHAACVINNIAYIWGWNGVNCALSRTVNQSDMLESASAPAPVEFLNDINVEIHSVECGKSHTLFLTSNGVYAMGGNHLGQLGIGKHMNQTTVPFLIRTLDGKNITQISAGHYHNAVVADGRLYTWGWGVYGQLGYGQINDIHEPKNLAFFNDKIILQISLGYAHTLVLCRDHNCATQLYVFGSNHYGQLGVGQDSSASNVDPALREKRNNNQVHRKSFVKSLVPIPCYFDEPIKYINTGYFANLAVSTSNQLYTWGISPQALRLSSQAKKRAKASQKLDETQTQSASEIKSEAELEKFEDVNIDVIKEEFAKEENSVGETNLELAATTTVQESEIEVDCVKNNSKDEECNKKSRLPILQEQTDHLYPMLVDTSTIIGDILRVSTGLYHCALIDSECNLYTWGKNLQRQLGREGTRNEVLVPTILESIKDAHYVECGADFTLVMQRDFNVKSFGNNNNGQCGKEINNEKSNFANKFIRLRGNSKKLVRIPDSNQCIESPVDIILPQPLLRSNMLRYMKSFPKFHSNFVLKSNLFTNIGKHWKVQSKGTDFNSMITVDANCNEYCTSDEDQSIEDDAADIARDVVNNLINSHGNNIDSETINNLINDRKKARQSERTCIVDQQSNEFNDFIHFCLYIFHGLYDQNQLIELSCDHFKEYKIRLLMLNYNYIEAFKLCLQHTTLDANKSIKLFEYFTKDGQIVPMKPENLKYFIYEILLHFIEHNLNLNDIEEFFIENIDHYLVQLAFVLFFNNNNNNNDLEKRIFEKFKNVFSDHEVDSENMSKLEKIDLIFKHISINFNVFVCEKLIEYAKSI